MQGLVLIILFPVTLFGFVFFSEYTMVRGKAETDESAGIST